ncbi:MAG TPA: hypothetical protein VN153_00670, partial [Tahibacter sp.]|nr:hypothetical protein [Tahibacter sp.]
MSAAPIPLCVDLDGTLIRSDLLFESALSLLRRNPFYLFAFVVWLAGGRARLKREIALRAEVDPAVLPYDERVIAWLRDHTEGYVSINVSPRHFRSDDFAERLLRLVDGAGADPR